MHDFHFVFSNLSYPGNVKENISHTKRSAILQLALTSWHNMPPHVWCGVFLELEWVCSSSPPSSTPYRILLWCFFLMSRVLPPWLMISTSTTGTNQSLILNRENYIYSFPWNVPKSHGPRNVPIWVTSEKFVMTHVQDTPDKYLTNICFEEISFVCHLLVCYLRQMPHTYLSFIKVRTQFVWGSCSMRCFQKNSFKPVT